MSKKVVAHSDFPRTTHRCISLPHTRITDIRLVFTANDIDNRLFYDIAKTWVKHFGTVTKLTVVWDRKAAGFPAEQPRLSETLTGAVRVASKWFGIAPEIVREEKKVTSNDKYLDILVACTWTWSAAKGSVLVWNA
jgi:hypothetical protein